MDVTNFIGGNTVTVDVVRNSPTKTARILTYGDVQVYDGKQKIKFAVLLDEKTLTYIPNKMSLKNIAERLGKETTAWMGKEVKLEVGIVNNKDSVIARVV